MNNHANFHITPPCAGVPYNPVLHVFFQITKKKIRLDWCKDLLWKIGEPLFIKLMGFRVFLSNTRCLCSFFLSRRASKKARNYMEEIILE